MGHGFILPPSLMPEVSIFVDWGFECNGDFSPTMTARAAVSANLRLPMSPHPCGAY